METVVKITRGSRGLRLVTIPRKLLPKIDGANFFSVGIDDTGRLVYTPLKDAEPAFIA